MRKTIMCLLAMMLIVSSASALFNGMDLQGYVDRYNSKVDQAPGILKPLLGNEQINVEIALNNGTMYKSGFIMENGRITSTIAGGVSSPSIEVKTSEACINRIASSNDPVGTFQQESDARNVTITGKSITTSIKLMAVLGSMDVLKFFANILLGK